MSDPRMTPQDQYLLVCLAEECAEVVQTVTKLLRFGPNDTHPTYRNGATNLEAVAQEADDVRALLLMLNAALPSDPKRIEAKMGRVIAFMDQRGDRIKVEDTCAPAAREETGQ